MFLTAIAYIYFIAPTVQFEQSVYTVNETEEEVLPVLVLTGLSSVNIIVQVMTFPGSATGKH